MAQQILDYVWVNNDCEIEYESISSTIIYSTLEQLPPIEKSNQLIKPVYIYINPFKSYMDLIVFCEVYDINYMCYPPQIHLNEQNKRNEFDIYMKEFASESFKITQYYQCDKLLFKQHKEACKHMNIDLFSKPNEYSLYCKKEDAYNLVWVTRYILYMIYNDYDITLTELKLTPNVDSDIIQNMNSMDMSCIDEIMDGFSI